MKRTWLLLLPSMGFISLLLAAGGWYVFVAGAPQLDPPQINEPNTGMSFRLERFASRSMAEQRDYGVILPPDYDNPQTQRYPHPS